MSKVRGLIGHHGFSLKEARHHLRGATSTDAGPVERSANVPFPPAPTSTLSTNSLYSDAEHNALVNDVAALQATLRDLIEALSGDGKIMEP